MSNIVLFETYAISFHVFYFTSVLKICFAILSGVHYGFAVGSLAASGCALCADSFAKSSALCSSRGDEVEKLTAAQPATLQDASEISGITPVALLHLHKNLNGRTRSPEDGASDSTQLSEDLRVAA